MGVSHERIENLGPAHKQKLVMLRTIKIAISKSFFTVTKNTDFINYVIICIILSKKWGH